MSAHKSTKKKVLNILLIPDNEEASPKNFRIRYSTISLMAILLGLLLISMIFGIVTYSQVLQAALEKKDLERKSMELRSQLRQTQELNSVLDTLKLYREKVRGSLQGYVQFAEKAGEEALSPSRLVESGFSRTSIFSSVPLSTPVIGFVSQEYRMLEHVGLDIVAPVGTPVKAAGGGTVIFSGYTVEDGYMLIIYHGGGYLTSYKHNARNLVTVNQTVDQGEVIAFLGNSGDSSGPHLHFEIWKDGSPLNPREFLSDLNSGD